jgi:hypothetical protein
MGVICLQEKRLASDKEKVHREMVDYFVNLDEERKLWYFTLAIRSHILRHDFTATQAESLVRNLTRKYGIRQASIETALAFKAFSCGDKKRTSKIVSFYNRGLSEEEFEEKLFALDNLFLGKIMEYRQALELVVMILNHYSDCRKVVGNA